MSDSDTSMSFPVVDIDEKDIERSSSNCRCCAQIFVIAIGLIIGLGFVLAGIFVSSGVRSLEELLSKKWQLVIGSLAGTFGVGIFMVSMIFSRVFEVKKEKRDNDEIEWIEEMEDVDVLDFSEETGVGDKSVKLFSQDIFLQEWAEEKSELKKWGGNLKNQIRNLKFGCLKAIENPEFDGQEIETLNNCFEVAMKKIDDKILEFQKHNVKDVPYLVAIKKEIWKIYNEDDFWRIFEEKNFFRIKIEEL